MPKTLPIKPTGSLKGAWSAYLRIPVMLPVPGGEYALGTSSEDILFLLRKESDWAFDWSDQDLFQNERPQHRVTLSPFEIALCPVTNQQYYQFTLDSGYRLPKTWVSYSFPKEREDHPVTGISYFDALEYIQWLNRQSAMEFRLPTEMEWEAAARGNDGRIYPWGNTFDPWRCNTSESGKKDTTPAGIYSPTGDSPCGAVDMVGNVWEWTSSFMIPYNLDPGEEPDPSLPAGRYVVRGGSWYYSRKFARCAAREGIRPECASHLIGLRLARNTPRE